jgi:Domain of unknown function (DUF1992)
MEAAMSWLSRMAERQMTKARLQGQLQGLAGEGKPLPERPGDAFISAGDAIGFRIMAEAGVLPEEITDAQALKATMAELARIEMRQAMAKEARRAFLKG